MGAADPTYPLLPIACILAAVMLLLVLLTSFIRQKLNLGVAFLCFWLLLENLGQAANAIIWSDNAEIKYYVYCDVVSHLQIITYIVTPMATLMITRRLYLIASLQSVDLPSKAARRWDSVIEWTLGFFIPLLVAGPIYYAHQGCRFEVDEVFGCTNAVRTSILEILTVDSWTVILPLVSISYFYPRVVHVLYRQSRDINSFLNSDTSVLRTNYLRILAVASIDILLTLPMGIVSIALRVRSILEEKGSLAFYLGWTCIHINWEPSSIPYAQLKASGIAGIAQLYFLRWSAPVLAYTIFGLFGLTYEARASYGLIGRTVGSWIGRTPTAPASDSPPSLGETHFAERLQSMSPIDVEMGSNRPSFAIPDVPVANQDARHNLDQSAQRSAALGLRGRIDPRIA